MRLVSATKCNVDIPMVPITVQFGWSKTSVFQSFICFLCRHIGDLDERVSWLKRTQKDISVVCYRKHLYL